MPRLGFAYKLGDRTVLRGGYGMYYGFLGQRRGDVQQIGFSQNTPLNVSARQRADVHRNAVESVPRAAFSTRPAQRPASRRSWDRTSPTSTRTRSRRGISGGRSASSASSAASWVAEARYVGNYGSQLETARNINGMPNEFLSTSPDSRRCPQQLSDGAGAESVCRPDAGVGPRGFPRRDDQRQQLLRPYPALRRRQYVDERGRVLVHTRCSSAWSGASRAGTRSASNYT